MDLATAKRRVDEPLKSDITWRGKRTVPLGNGPNIQLGGLVGYALLGLIMAEFTRLVAGIDS
jgi:hypothetical protein